jgi:hypothetical protein
MKWDRGKDKLRSQQDASAPGVHEPSWMLVTAASWLLTINMCCRPFCFAHQAAKPESNSPHEHYLMGPFYTTAEVLCTPYVARMVLSLPEWRGMDVLQDCEGRKLVRVAGWMRACLARPAAKLTGPNRKELVDGLVEWEWSHAV